MDSPIAEQYWPSATFDEHFAKVPNFKSADFNAGRCALLLHRVGIPIIDLPKVHVYIRPDYESGAYTKAERAAIKKTAPDDYTDAGSCAMRTMGMPKQYGVEIMIAHGNGSHGSNALLRHEAVHARGILRALRLIRVIGYNDAMNLVTGNEHVNRAEEFEADRAMSHPLLKSLGRRIIEIKDSNGRLLR